jgi:hypothetical protein
MCPTWFTYQRRKEQRLVLLFKIVNDLVAIPADNNIEYNQRPSRTSNSKQIKVLSATTEIYTHSFFARPVKDWNTLTDSAVSSKTVEGFKRKVSRLASLNRYYIIIDEVFSEMFLMIIDLLVVYKKHNYIKIKSK